MKTKSIKLCRGVYVHTQEFGGDSAWQHVKVMSERHAERICAMLGWGERHGGAGQFYRSTWYDKGAKRLVSRCGYDV